MNNDPEMTNETHNQQGNDSQPRGDQSVDDSRADDPNQGNFPDEMVGNRPTDPHTQDVRSVQPPDTPAQSNVFSSPLPQQRPNMVETMTNTKPEDMRMPQIFTQEELTDFRSKWKDIQVQFIDSPCSAVEQGDTLVADVLERVKEAITRQQELLNKQWLDNDDISTEELRVTLRSYRLFLDRLLSLGE